MIKLMPKVIAIIFIKMLFKIALFRARLDIFVDNMWLNHYLKKLESTKNYYKTLSELNSNSFVSSDVNPLFIENVQIRFPQLMHS
jgi:hypothetical protein